MSVYPLVNQSFQNAALYQQCSLVQSPPQAVASFRRKLYSKAQPARSDPEGKENLVLAFAGREVSVGDGKPPNRQSLPVTII